MLYTRVYLHIEILVRYVHNITALIQCDVHCLCSGQLQSWLDVTHIQLKKLVHALSYTGSLHTHLQHEETKGSVKKGMTTLWRTEWDMIGEWQNSNTKRSWRGLQHENAGFVCRHRKPTKSQSVLQLRIKPRTSLVIITAYRLVVQFVLEITRHESDAISEL